MAIKEFLSASFGLAKTDGVTFSNSVSVNGIPPGKTARVYCYATGDYYSGNQTWVLSGTLRHARYTAFHPVSMGYRVSYQ
jgi:hypothetical protein